MKQINGFYIDIVNASGDMKETELIGHIGYCLGIAEELLLEEKVDEDNEMWVGHLPYLVMTYIRELLEQLIFISYKNWEDYDIRYNKLRKKILEKPVWLEQDLVESHCGGMVEKLE